MCRIWSRQSNKKLNTQVRDSVKSEYREGACVAIIENKHQG